LKSENTSSPGSTGSFFVAPEKFFMLNGQPYQHFLNLVSAGKIGLIATDEPTLW